MQISSELNLWLPVVLTTAGARKKNTTISQTAFAAESPTIRDRRMIIGYLVRLAFRRGKRRRLQWVNEGRTIVIFALIEPSTLKDFISARTTMS